MSDDWGSITDVDGGSFFKAAENAKAVGILFRPISIREEVQTKFGVKDWLIADMHIFATLDDIRAGKPSEVMLGAVIEGAGMVNTGRRVLEAKKREVYPVRLDQKDTGKGNPMWKFIPPEGDVAAKLIDYWKGLQASEQQADDDLDAMLNG